MADKENAKKTQKDQKPATEAAGPTSGGNDQAERDALDRVIARVSEAQKKYAAFSQKQVDDIFRAAALAANEARIPLAKMAVEETGMGVVEDKVIKNHFASEYVYNKYKNEKTCGELEYDETFGIIKVAEPVGLIAGIVPTTNPTSTAIFKSLLALKTRNGIIFSPHPRAKKSTIAAAKILLDAAVAAGAPDDIIGWIEEPTVAQSQHLMSHPAISMILATGGPGMVKAAYSSGIPALGVGPGNTPAVMDETCDIQMAPGYFNLRQGSDVADRLYARALVIDNGKNTAAIISVDGCSVGDGIREPIVERIEKYTGIKPESILIGYTHAHTGTPAYGYNGDADAMDCQKGYDDVIVRLIADCATLAYYRLAESSVCFDKGAVKGISFCRNYYMKNSTPRTNPPKLDPDIIGPTAEIDEELPVLLVKDENGNPKGAVISYACHPDCVDGTRYSGDYISELELQLKKLYGQDFVTVFLLGTGGNINNFDVSKLNPPEGNYRKMGQLIAGEAAKLAAFAEPVEGDELITRLKYIKLGRTEISDEAIENAKHIVATVKEIPGIKIAADNTSKDQYDLAMSKILLNFLKTVPEIIEVPLQFIKIGDFELYAFPSEIFCCFGMMVKDGVESDKCMVASVCNKSIGYVPSREMFYETIYESLPGSNKLEREAGYIMAEELIKLGK